MLDYKKIVKNREFRLKLIRLLSFIPDAQYLKLVYKIKTGKKLNLDHPTGFNEKENWLKLHNQKAEYTDLVDKVEVKQIVDAKIGKGHTIPTLGAWDKFDDIDFDSLPQAFVLKCSHDSGSVKLIYDKSQMEKAKLKTFFDGRMKLNSFCIGREYPYKNVKPRILAEPLIREFENGAINDYKFFCFHGEPKIMFVATDRDTDCRFDFFDMEFNHLDIENIHPNSDKKIEKPETFEQMKAFAKTLSAGIPFVRMDFYEIDGTVYFGEYTFFHGGGFWPMKPEKWEKQLGEWLTIEE